MIKRLILILTILTIAATVWGQVTITGIVISREDGSPIPGVNVVEKGTKNGTATKNDGTFSINVNDHNSTLIFSSFGLNPQEIQLNRLKGKREVLISMKLNCSRDFFDAQRIGIYASSGLINTPVGGQFELAFPSYFGEGTLTSGISFQTNLNENEFVNGQIEFKHFIWTCDFDMDVNWYYRKVHFGNDFNSRAYSFESNLNFGRLRLIAGYSNLNFYKVETNERQTSSGPMVGIGTWIGGPLRLRVTGKAAIYRNDLEYIGQIARESKHVNVFVKFYKLDSFTEFSLGIGTEIGYRLKRQRR